MKNVISALICVLCISSFAADSTINNLPTNSVSVSDKMVWEIPGIADYGITYGNFTNQALTGMASTNWVYSNFMTNGSVSGGGAPLSGTNTWTGTNTFTIPIIGSAANLTNLPIASITTPGVIVTQGFSPAMTFSNAVNVVGTNSVSKLLVGGAAAGADAVNVTGSLQTSTSLNAGSWVGAGTYITLGSVYSIGWASRMAIYSPAANKLSLRDASTGQKFPGGMVFFGDSESTNPCLKSINGSTPGFLILNAATNGAADLVVSGAGTFTNGLTSYGDVTISGASSDLSVDGYTTNKLGLSIGTNAAFFTADSFLHTNQVTGNFISGTNGALTVSSGGTNWLGYTVVTNLRTFTAQTDSTLGFTNLYQPIGNFGFLSMYTTNLINGGANTYAPITNYTVGRSNVMGCNLVGGVITNINSGFYKVGIHLSGVAVDNSAIVEGDLLLNGVEKDEVSFLTQFDNPPRVKGMSALGILYITNGTPVTFQVKSSGAGGINIWRAQMTLSTP